jgi:two-component system sensor histidine kinase PilS (NtrC family)
VPSPIQGHPPIAIPFEQGITPKLKWMMFVRIVFCVILLFATVFFHVQQQEEFVGNLGVIFYFLAGASFIISLLYLKQFRPIKYPQLFSYSQLGIDSFIVTLIVFISGGYFSLFTFLYLVIIIYASMIAYMKGGLWVALLSSLQYAALIVLQFFNYFPSVSTSSGVGLSGVNGIELLNKLLITTTACFAVAVLSGLLTEQNRKSQNELRAMELHVKRVEKMAYMGEMAAGLAHEIKNPLASVVGSIQLLKEDLRYDPDHQRLMEIILRETDRLGTLVNDFLLFARPPAGKPKILDLNKAIEETIGLFERDKKYAPRHKLKKILVPDIFVVMDPGHLSQVLWNLLLNAAEAIQGEGAVEIHMVPTKNTEVVIVVKDNGCGIPPDIEQSIFDPFFTTKSEGTGLGLSIVHRILEAYNSRLDIQTKPGVGTTVSFTLKRSGKPA